MKIAVIGAGIVGLCTAYELVQDGHQVSVFERNSAVAQEASFACAGHLSPSLSHPLAFPHWPAGSWLRALAAPSFVTLHKGISVSDLRWLYGWKTAHKNHLDTLATAHALVSYSLERWHAASLKESLALEQSQGHLVLWQSEAALARFKARLGAMKDFGLAAQILTPDEARAAEPALQADFAFHAATYFPADEVGNCRQYAHLLKEKLNQAGAPLHFGTAVRTMTTAGTGVQVQTAGGDIYPFEQVVVCAGAESASLTESCARLALTTLWSHSLSAPIREPLNAPRSAVQDAQRNMTITRMGARVRVAGGAALGARNNGQDATTVNHLYRTLNTLFPGAADFSRSAQVWRGASQFTPDGLPLIGNSGAPGIWLHTGHGHNGWAMACGGARIVADLMAGKATDIDATKLQPGRFLT